MYICAKYQSIQVNIVHNFSNLESTQLLRITRLTNYTVSLYYSGFFIETEPRIYDEELSYVIMEVEKSHDMLSVSWEPRKAGSVVIVQEQRSKTMHADVRGEKEMILQLKQRK